MQKDTLSTRMKTYEAVPKTKLMAKTPVIIRLDGKAAHTFTRGFKKPYDEVFIASMSETTKYLCENIQGCIFGYTQSDEITLVLQNWYNIDTSSWYDNNVEKIVSVSASMATFYFNRAFEKYANQVIEKSSDKKYNELLTSRIKYGLFFDSRCFNVPFEEVANVLIWRQLDAIRNSIQGLAQSEFSHKELQGLNSIKLKEKLLDERSINWDDLENYKRQGICYKRGEKGFEEERDTPYFIGEKEYIESLLRKS